MIHARRIKPKRNSTKEMLESTVSNTGAEKVTLAEAQRKIEHDLKSSKTEVSSEMSARAASRQKAKKKIKAFDAAFAALKPTSKSRVKTPKTVKSQEIVQDPLKKFFKRLVYLAIFCVLAFVLLSLSFRTETVIVQGNQQLMPSEVQSLSKIEVGTPLLWVTERNVKNLLRNPWIDNVKINREFPHTVLIEVVERTPVALFSIDSGEQIGTGVVQNQAAYSADGLLLSNVPTEVLAGLTPIDGWGQDRSFEGLELLNYLNHSSELSVTKIDYTPEGFEASFEYGLFENESQETSFILGQLQTPSLTLLKEHWSAFVHALATSETGELKNMAGLPEDKLIVPAPLNSGGQDDQETRRIVKRKWITIYGWGVSLSE